MALLLALLFVFASCSRALQVTPGSSCAALCLDNSTGNAYNPDDSNTTPDDIVCNDMDYWSTSTGSKFRNCMNCLQNSTAVNGTENDAEWFLYNIRYAVDVCLYSYPSASASASNSSPCALAATCMPLETPLKAGNLKPTNATEFQYCEDGGVSFEGTSLNNCIQCLEADESQTYLSNFLTALSAGCQQRPIAGALLGVSGTMFATTTIAIVAASNQTDTGNSSGSSMKHLPTGAIIGICVGGALLIIIALSLFIFYWKRHRNDIDNSAWRHSNESYPGKSINTMSSASDAQQYLFDMDTHPIHPVTQQQTARVTRQPFAWPCTRSGRPAPLTIPSSQKQPQWVQPPDLQSLPAHPAYMPQSRPSRRLPLETEITPRTTTQSDESSNFALQRYLDTVTPPAAASTFHSAVAKATEATQPIGPSTIAMHPPPPSAPAQPAASYQPQQMYGVAESYGHHPVITAPIHTSPTTTRVSKPPAPALIIPSLTRIRGPKQYIPPNIKIGSRSPESRTGDLFD